MSSTDDAVHLHKDNQTHVMSALINKQRELMGLIEHHEAEIMRIRESMDHVEATMRLFDPEFNMRGVKTKQRRVKSAYFAHGEVAQSVLAMLREAGEKGISTKEAADILLKEKKVDNPPKKTISSVQKTVLQAMKMHERKRIVRHEMDHGGVYRWFLDAEFPESD